MLLKAPRLELLFRGWMTLADIYFYCKPLFCELRSCMKPAPPFGGPLF